MFRKREYSDHCGGNTVSPKYLPVTSVYHPHEYDTRQLVTTSHPESYYKLESICERKEAVTCDPSSANPTVTVIMSNPYLKIVYGT